jgi:hypothetical protein
MVAVVTLAVGCGGEPTGTAATAGGPGCNPSYEGACVPDDGYDHDCPEVAHQVTIVGPDTDRLDRDGNGLGCESYG